MKTWAAGLAYSNGMGSHEKGGRLTYYAERCPDLTETMRFVVSELENAVFDPRLGDYAIAQVFNWSRGSRSYEGRGIAMAADLLAKARPMVSGVVLTAPDDDATAIVPLISTVA